MVYYTKKYCDILKLIDESKLNVFFMPEYAKTLGKKTKNEMRYIISDSMIIPVVICSFLIFKYAFFPTIPVHYGNKDIPSNFRVYIDEVMAFLRRSGVQWTGPTMASSPFPDYPTESVRIPWGTYLLDLSKSEEELLSGMHSKHRNVVKKAKKDGVCIKIGGMELLEDYIILEQKTWERSDRKSNGINYYNKLFYALGDMIDIAIAYFNQKPQSGAIIYWNQAEAFYMFGASIDTPHIGSGNLLQWELINRYKNKGVKQYNFVGCRINVDEESKYSGIQRYKERFGGELRQGFMFKSVFNPGFYKLFTTIRRMIGKPESKDAIDQELKKWQELNCQIIKRD